MGTSTDITVSRYLEQQASAHRIDARSKILMLAVYSVGIFFVDTWWGMAAYALILAAVAAGLKAPLRKVLAIGIPVYVIAGLTIFFNMFAAGEGGIAFSQAGLIRGCFFAARILMLVWFSLVVCFTVEATELTQAFTSIMAPLRAIRVPVDDIAMVFSIALRFIPQMAEEYFQIKHAQWSRCAEFDEGPIIERVKAHCAIMVPMFIGMFRRADRLASSMDARCYGMRNVVRTDIRATRMNAPSIAVGIGIFALCLCVSILL